MGANIVERRGLSGVDIDLRIGAHRQSFSALSLHGKAAQDQLYAVLAPIIERFNAVSADEQLSRSFHFP
jgi:hypothetical protein